jgi:hypothetical protein
MAAGEAKTTGKLVFFSVFSMKVANIMLNCKPGHTLETKLKNKRVRENIRSIPGRRLPDQMIATCFMQAP